MVPILKESRIHVGQWNMQAKVEEGYFLLFFGDKQILIAGPCETEGQSYGKRGRCPEQESGTALLAGTP